LRTDSGGITAPQAPTDIRTREDFAEALTALREHAGLTVRHVADAVGAPASTVGGYFSGRHLPPISQPALLADILRVCGVRDAETVRLWQYALGRVRRAPGPRPADAAAPYRGLASYQPEDADWFFGRRDLTALVLARLGQRWAKGGGPVVVIGPSGSGKSSVLRAGVIPAVRTGRLDPTGSVGWPVVLLTPGSHPVAALAGRLADLVGIDAGEVADGIRKDPAICAEYAERAVDTAATHGLLIIVDQLEELFTETPVVEERQAFLAALDAVSRSAAGSMHAPAAVVLGLRADFYHQALRDRHLLPALQTSQVAVGPMTEPSLNDVIVGPARKAGITIEDGLVEIILRDLAPGVRTDDSGVRGASALPLLSHALLATWERSPAGRLTVAAYKDVGGIDGSVASAADAVIDSMSESEQHVVRELMVRLVRVGEGMPHTRRQVSPDELAQLLRPEVTEDLLRGVLDQLAASRLVTVDVDAVEITHEALISVWPRLQAWIEADRHALLLAQQLDDAADQWNRDRRDAALLLRGSRLAAAREWADGGGRLSPLAGEFLRASFRRERRRVRTLKGTIAGLATLLVLAVGGGAYAYHLRGEAEAARAVATEERNAALSRMVAIRADRLRETDPALAEQLAMVAYQTAPTIEARSSLLSASAGPAVTRMLGPDGLIQAIAMSGDGGLLAGAGADGSVRVWDVGTTAAPIDLTAELPGIGGVVNALDFHPTEPLIAATGTDQRVYLYDLQDPSVPVRLGGGMTEPTGDLNAVAFSPDGNLVAAGGVDETVWLWDVSDPSQPALLTEPLAEPSASVTTVAFSPDGPLLAAGGYDRAAYLWDVSDPTSPALLGEPLTGPTLAVFDLEFSADGRMLAAASADRHVYLWGVEDPAAPEALEPLAGPTSWVNTVTFSPGGHVVAAGSSDGMAWLWDLSGDRVAETLPHPGPVTGVAFEADGQALFTSAADGVARRWGLPGPVMTAATDAVHEIAYHPTAPTVAMASGDGAVYLWDVQDALRPVPLGEPVTSPDEESYLIGAAVFSPDGETMVSAGLDGTVWRWDVGDPSAPVPMDPPLRGLSTFAERLTYSPDGCLLAGGAADGTVALWDISDGARPELLTTINEPSLNVLAVAFSPDGRTLAGGGVDSVVWLWDVTDPARPVLHSDPLTGPTNSVYWLTFHPSGETLAVGSADGTVRLWDVSDLAEPRSGPILSGPDGYVVGLAVSPDGARLAAASTDHTLWVWDIADLDEPVLDAVLAGATGGLHAVSFDHSGDLLIAAGQDPTGRIWHTSTDRIAAHICATQGDSITETEWAKLAPGLPYAPPCS
jgi:WD40 repeat protein/transcriptional regulator with XRE-family HTH domain